MKDIQEGKDLDEVFSDDDEKEADSKETDKDEKEADRFPGDRVLRLT